VLQAFLVTNRAELIARCKSKAAKRLGEACVAGGAHGVPVLLEQIGDNLALDRKANSGATFEANATPTNSELGQSAASHGTEMLHRGYRVDQVVHEYGDVCQAVTELAEELQFTIRPDEFRTLNQCLDNAIADAVTSYGSAAQGVIKNQSDDLQVRLVHFSKEQHRLVEIASSAFGAIRAGNVGPSGATGNLLVHTLAELFHHGDRVLAVTALAAPRHAPD
jgi:hypothetical protein